ncbi:MAG: NAD(P)H-dependent glycerol-3-phosphate dehydrogenase [Firmicutes bacterium]|nr:NAD(P)H-dependent glycerol-3-phosphate dehydrogenase [Bacillota bacterium]MCM1400631.1 NAD(P)H-dependent glycerol-3-phosphate dehydrogenase [Bacteroides sp.]MCM1477774.1 NAD(P)H-dependent glycerol-3-phosphate dehydrogenase [Bacteroides sp.]
MKFPGKIAVMGGGSWATALAKLLLDNRTEIVWYFHRNDRIEEFKRTGRNPAYLSDVVFDTSRIIFTSSINEAASLADTLLLAMPSPYFKSQIGKLTVDISHKAVVSAIKGIVPDDNMIVSDYMENHFHINSGRSLVVSGPCHAEEVAMGRQSYLTVGCNDIFRAEQFANALRGPVLRTITSSDVAGIEYAAVLKNVYAICSGICHGLSRGDNFQAMLVSNAVMEMDRFVRTVAPRPRNICDSVYLGDLLVTSYSRFSRNHNFGSLIGRGYAVKAARMEMVQTAEGYYAAKCMHQINKRHQVTMPIMEGVYSILYHNANPAKAIAQMADTFV